MIVQNEEDCTQLSNYNKKNVYGKCMVDKNASNKTKVPYHQSEELFLHETSLAKEDKKVV